MWSCRYLNPKRVIQRARKLSSISHTKLLGDKNYSSYLQTKVAKLPPGPSFRELLNGSISQEKKNKRRGQVSGRGVRGSRILIDNLQPSGPRNIVDKGWIFMSFWSWGAFLVGRSFKCGCVGDEWPMTPRTENEDCRETSCCYRLKRTQRP